MFWQRNSDDDSQEDRSSYAIHYRAQDRLCGLLKAADSEILSRELTEEFGEGSIEQINARFAYIPAYLTERELKQTRRFKGITGVREKMVWVVRRIPEDKIEESKLEGYLEKDFNLKNFRDDLASGLGGEDVIGNVVEGLQFIMLNLIPRQLPHARRLAIDNYCNFFPDGPVRAY